MFRRARRGRNSNNWQVGFTQLMLNVRRGAGQRGGASRLNAVTSPNEKEESAPCRSDSNRWSNFEGRVRKIVKIYYLFVMNSKSEVTSVRSLPQTAAAMFTCLFMSFMQPVAPKHITAMRMAAERRALTTGTRAELPSGTGLPADPDGSPAASVKAPMLHNHSQLVCQVTVRSGSPKVATIVARRQEELCSCSGWLLGVCRKQIKHAATDGGMLAAQEQLRVASDLLFLTLKDRREGNSS